MFLSDAITLKTDFVYFKQNIIDGYFNIKETFTKSGNTKPLGGQVPGTGPATSESMQSSNHPQEILPYYYKNMGDTPVIRIPRSQNILNFPRL